MEANDFLSINVTIIGVSALIVFLYIIVLFRKRRKKNFTHDSPKP